MTCRPCTSPFSPPPVRGRPFRPPLVRALLPNRLRPFHRSSRKVTCCPPFCQYVPHLPLPPAAGRRGERRWAIWWTRLDPGVRPRVPRFRGRAAGHIDGPPDVEDRGIGLSGGHIFQGECLPAFMWDRRLPYRTGADGVYLCGAATPPRRQRDRRQRPQRRAGRRLPTSAGSSCRLRAPNSLQRVRGAGDPHDPSGRIPGWCPGSASSASPSANPVGKRT